MRIEVLTPRLEVEPGGTCEVELEVFNTGEVIDTVTSRLVGHLPLSLEQRPAAVSLFPGTSERITVAFTLPHDYPAGDHQIPVEVVSAVAPQDRTTEVEVALDVAPHVSASMDLVPSDVTAGRRAKLSAHIANDGNTPVNLALSGSDLERALVFSFDPPFVRVDPGQHVYVAARTSGKRPLFGLPVPRQATIVAEGPGVLLTQPARVNQKPWIPRGLVTVFTLACIIGLWAVVITKGADLVLDREKLTKSAPAAFLVGETDFSTAAVAGSMTGTVTASTNGLPVERMTVEAYRIRRNSRQLIQSAASGEDGTWSLQGIIPGNYHVRFSAPGYQDTWYPSAPDEAGASVVAVRPVAETSGLDVQVTGLPGTIQGAIAAGEQQVINGIITVRKPLPTEEAAAPADESAGAATVPVAAAQVDPAAPVTAAAGPEMVTMVTSNPDGTFSIPSLPTPASYELTFSLEGFTDQVVPVTLGGGETQVINTVQMAAGEGVLAGTVSSGSTPLGGVVITVSGGGKTFTATTPTSGPVGQWSVSGLPTPATYIVTFALEGYGTETMALDLAAGEVRADVDVGLVSGTGSISGTVSDSSGQPLGDVTVTVTGSAEPVETKTLTTGQVGAYTLNGLVTPGRYTVTYALEGYTSVTRAVTLADSGLATGVDVTLGRSTGSITGTVRENGEALAGAEITLTDGRTERGTVSADEPKGEFRFDGLPAGTYTATVELDGYDRRTVLVTVEAGATATLNVSLTES